jgi:hypothetical protein
VRIGACLGLTILFPIGSGVAQLPDALNSAATDERAAPTTQEVIPQFALREIWRVGDAEPVPGREFAGPFMVIAVGPNGAVAVLDQTLAKITILDSDEGDFVRRFGRRGRGPGELGGAVAMTWDEAGRLWVEDQRNRRYNVYDSLGASVATFPRPASSANRRVFPIRHLSDGTVLDHEIVGSDLRVFAADSLGKVKKVLGLALPDRDRLSGPVPSGSAVQAVVGLLPSLRWTLSSSGPSVWLARSDSLNLLRLGLDGDTLSHVRSTHRRAAFTSGQLEAIRLANRELGRVVDFVPVLVQALHAMADGRVLAQIGTDVLEPGRELDMFAPSGVLLGTIRAPFAIHHRSELGSSGDTLFVHAVGEYDVPLLIKAVIEPISAPGRN